MNYLDFDKTIADAIENWKAEAEDAEKCEKASRFHYAQGVVEGLERARLIIRCASKPEGAIEQPTTTESAIAQFFGLSEELSELSEELSELQHYAAQKLEALEEVITNLGRTLNDSIH